MVLWVIRYPAAQGMMQGPWLSHRTPRGVDCSRGRERTIKEETRRILKALGSGGGGGGGNGDFATLLLSQVHRSSSSVYSQTKGGGEESRIAERAPLKAITPQILLDGVSTWETGVSLWADGNPYPSPSCAQWEWHHKQTTTKKSTQIAEGVPAEHCDFFFSFWPPPMLVRELTCVVCGQTQLAAPAVQL